MNTTHAAQRFGFDGGPPRNDAPLTFLPDRPKRVSLIWWAHGPDDASPLFADKDGAPATLIAVWPTLVDGQLDVTRLADVDVREWRLGEQPFAELRETHERFHLGQYDVIVWRAVDRVLTVPTFESGSVYARALQSREPLGAAIRDRIARAFKAAPLARAA